MKFFSDAELHEMDQHARYFKSKTGTMPKDQTARYLSYFAGKFERLECSGDQCPGHINLICKAEPIAGGPLSNLSVVNFVRGGFTCLHGKGMYHEGNIGMSAGKIERKTAAEVVELPFFNSEQAAIELEKIVFNLFVGEKATATGAMA